MYLLELPDSKYDSVYGEVVDIARHGIKVFNDLKLPKKTVLVHPAKFSPDDKYMRLCIAGKTWNNLDDIE